MELEALQQLVTGAMEDIKAFDIKVIDVQGRNSMTDRLVFASGRSDRQVKAIAGNVIEESKKAGHQPLGVEGMNTGDWVLVDLNDIVHCIITIGFIELHRNCIEHAYERYEHDASAIDDLGVLCNCSTRGTFIPCSS